jgi:hypothetical protein
MFQNLHLPKPESDYQLEYYNAIGLLFSDHLILNKDNKLIEFNIDEIINISDHGTLCLVADIASWLQLERKKKQKWKR